MSIFPFHGRSGLGSGFWLRRVEVLWVTLFGLLAAACDNRPAANTPEYRQAHGLVEGRDNSVSVGATRLRIPAAIPIDVHTNGPIQPGRADTLTLYLEFPGLLEQPRDLGRLSPSTVRVEIKDLPGAEEHLAPLLRDDPRWQRVVDRPDLGLTEYHDRQFDGGWGYISYQALAAQDRTPLRAPIQLACSGFPVGTVSQCRGEFRMPAGPHVWYFISADLLPHWREVQRVILETTEALTRELPLEDGASRPDIENAVVKMARLTGPSGAPGDSERGALPAVISTIRSGTAAGINDGCGGQRMLSRFGVSGPGQAAVTGARRTARGWP